MKNKPVINTRNDAYLFSTATLSHGFEKFIIRDCQLLLMEALLVVNGSLFAEKVEKTSKKYGLIDIVKLKFANELYMEVTSTYDILDYCQSVGLTVTAPGFDQSVFYTDHDLREKTPEGLLKDIIVDLQNLFDNLKGTKI